MASRSSPSKSRTAARERQRARTAARREASREAIENARTATEAFTTADAELIAEQWYRAARRSFWAFRQLMHPNMKRGWFQREMAHELQLFYEDLVSGRKPKMVVQAPPQHGKSETITDFIAWLAGRNPELRSIFASYSERLGTRTNLRIQRMMDTEKYRRTFPETFLWSNEARGTGAQHLRNREMLEYVGHEGSFRNTTIMGPINGEGLDLGLIDDPIKGRAEANSRTTRDRVWEWLTDDFLTRFSEDAGLLIILTRWHIDDPVGRLIAEDPSVRVLKYSAIATSDEHARDGTLLRRKGEALFPEHKSLAFLKARRKVMSTPSWESIYQQSPIVQGGELFPVDKFTAVPFIPAGCKVVRSVRYWDKAGTQGGGKFTAGVLMGLLTDGRYIVLDVVRAQLGYHDREVTIKKTAKDDGVEVTVWVEQEPGSGGKESAQRTVANLAGYSIWSDKVQGDKYTRAEPYAGQVQGENVLMLTAPWNKKFLEEHEYFPNGPYKDQVDAAAGAFAKLSDTGGKTVKALW